MAENLNNWDFERVLTAQLKIRLLKEHQEEKQLSDLKAMRQAYSGRSIKQK